MGRGELGWRDLSLDRAREWEREVVRVRDAQRAVFASDYRPHTHLFELSQQIPTEGDGAWSGAGVIGAVIEIVTMFLGG